MVNREALTIRWACEKSYMYLIGSKLTVETDHNQYVLSIINNANSRPPIRIELWLLYLSINSVIST